MDFLKEYEFTAYEMSVNNNRFVCVDLSEKTNEILTPLSLFFPQVKNASQLLSRVERLKSTRQNIELRDYYMGQDDERYEVVFKISNGELYCNKHYSGLVSTKNSCEAAFKVHSLEILD